MRTTANMKAATIEPTILLMGAPAKSMAEITAETKVETTEAKVKNKVKAVVEAKIEKKEAIAETKTVTKAGKTKKLNREITTLTKAEVTAEINIETTALIKAATISEARADVVRPAVIIMEYAAANKSSRATDHARKLCGGRSQTLITHAKRLFQIPRRLQPYKESATVHTAANGVTVHTSANGVTVHTSEKGLASHTSESGLEGHISEREVSVQNGENKFVIFNITIHRKYSSGSKIKTVQNKKHYMTSAINTTERIINIMFLNQNNLRDFLILRNGVDS